jgi:hypothetical protein
LDSRSRSPHLPCSSDALARSLTGARPIAALAKHDKHGTTLSCAWAVEAPSASPRDYATSRDVLAVEARIIAGVGHEVRSQPRIGQEYLVLYSYTRATQLVNKSPRR